MVTIKVSEDSIEITNIDREDPKEREFVAAAIKAWLERRSVDKYETWRKRALKGE